MGIEYDTSEWGTDAVLKRTNIFTSSVVNKADVPHKSINSLLARLDSVGPDATSPAAHPGHDHTGSGKGKHIRKSVSCGYAYDSTQNTQQVGFLDLNDIAAIDYPYRMEIETHPHSLFCAPPGGEVLDVTQRLSIDFTATDYSNLIYQIGFAIYPGTTISDSRIGASGFVWGPRFGTYDLPMDYTIAGVPVDKDTGISYGTYFIKYRTWQGLYTELPNASNIYVSNPSMFSRAVY